MKRMRFNPAFERRKTLQGLEVVECLKVVSSVVPEQFLTDRNACIHRIVNLVVAEDKQLSAPMLYSRTIDIHIQ